MDYYRQVAGLLPRGPKVAGPSKLGTGHPNRHAFLFMRSNTAAEIHAESDGSPVPYRHRTGAARSSGTVEMNVESYRRRTAFDRKRGPGFRWSARQSIGDNRNAAATPVFSS